MSSQLSRHVLPEKHWCRHCQLYVRSCTHDRKYNKKHKYSVASHEKPDKSICYWVLEDKFRVIAECFVQKDAIMIVRSLA